MKKLVVMGDVHGNFGLMNTFLQPDTIYLQVGDFGFWPHIAQAQQANSIKVPEGSVIYTCMGNHENWDELDKFGYNITELTKNVFYCPFGTELEINGYKILFVGKADSPDKSRRIPHVSWWPQEIPGYKDLDRINFESKPDIVISHTVPYMFETMNDFPDPTRKCLDIILNELKPTRWFAGHFHKYFNGFTEDCKWTVLTDIPKEGWLLEIK